MREERQKEEMERQGEKYTAAWFETSESLSTAQFVSGDQIHLVLCSLTAVFTERN